MMESIFKYQCLAHDPCHAISKSHRANDWSRFQPNDGGGQKSRQAAHDDADAQRVLHIYFTSLISIFAIDMIFRLASVVLNCC